MKITKYFLTISEDKVFIKETYSDMLNSSTTTTSTTSLTASTNTISSASNYTQNPISSINGIAATVMGTLGTTIDGLWYNKYDTYSLEYIAYVDFFNCGLSLKLNSNNEFKVDGLFYDGKKYLYIIDTKLKQNILIADLNYTSFHEMFLGLTIKNLFEIIEL